MATAAPLHEAEKVAEQQDEKPSVAPAEQTEEKKTAEDVAPEQQAAVPAPSSDEKIPVEPQLAPYPPSSVALSPTLSPALSSASVPGSPFTATATTPPPPLSAISSTDTDKVAVTPVMGQYPTDPSQQPPAPMYPDHTGSTSPHQQYTIQPDHAYHQQPPYDHNQYYAQQQQQQQQQQHPGAQQYRTATPIANLNRSPAPVDCPACGHRALTATTFQTGNTTHAWAFGVCLCLCLGCIPYLMSSTKDVQHKCGKCGVLLATWHRSGNTDVHMHA
ncbi:Lipopolysaccharide-induced transcription factor regulating tumor necrosis factor [Lasiodiplodia theobromae]|uniref:Lipopolysaccharide-induced transcription factor regulating tumor necrosis factor n=1 Tax=Lasiodiplodia theobromae TaxID=45133 RepID=UPI0015C2D5D8|nr:Lipopolysaccharide-induced transcription factor regulating tumor necrosis factor [Lasiodiplodia theobromae]KAF4546699.1 Lipopolysaccharide-induced transcription factor regulating tumor necrosis factor [Lasiodiplodia theobromae]